MSKLILTGLGAVAALSLSACGERAEENNMAVENIEELNTTSDMNMDLNAMDMNATDMNAADMKAATDNMMGNDTAENATGY